MKTYQRRWINEQEQEQAKVAPAEIAAFKAFLLKTDPKSIIAKNSDRLGLILSSLHELGEMIGQNLSLKPIIITGLEKGDLTSAFKKATAEKTKAGAAPPAAEAPPPAAGAPPPAAEAFSIKEEVSKRNSSFIKYLFEGAAAKKEEPKEEEPEETEKEEPEEERPKKVEAPKEKKKEKEGSAVSNLLDSLDEVPAAEWKRITDADEAFEVIVRGVMKKFTGITYAERQQLKIKFISAFRSVKPDA